MSFRILSFGEALWDLLPDESVLGGAPLNFAYRAGTLGMKASLISRVGKDDLGKSALSRMKTLGMDISLIQEDETRPTGTVDVTFDDNRNPDYVINENAAYDYISQTGALDAAVKEADCVCFGSLAQRTSVSKETLHGILNNFRGGYLLYDINLRKKCYTPDIIQSSLNAANVVKLNETELVELKTMLGLSSEGLSALGKELASAFSISPLVVTLGGKGAFAVTGGETEYALGYTVSVEDSLGAGDAFTAGFMYALLSGKPIIHALTMGNALGALVAGQKGATQETTMDELKKFMSSGIKGPVHPEFR